MSDVHTSQVDLSQVDLSQAELHAALTRLHREGGTGNRLIVSRGPAWFALRAALGDREASCTAAPQRHLGDAIKLSAEGIIALRMAGFAKAAGARSLSRAVDIATDAQRADLARLLPRWLSEVYGPSDGPVTAELRLGERVVLDNDRLHQAIRHLAKARSQGARQAVYQALLHAQLLLLVDGSGSPAPCGELQGFHTYAIFTSAAESDLWDPRGLRVKQLPGWSIFPRLAALKPGSLQINPDGRLGGELYRNEVEALADACGAFRNR